MNQAQGAQWLDQGQLAPVKRAKLLIAFQQSAELLGLLAPVAGQQHPQILYCRAAAGVVQVHKMRATAHTVAGFIQGRPQHIAGVAVAVQAQLGGALQTKVPGLRQAISGWCNQVQGLLAGGFPALAHFQRNRIAAEQVLHAVIAKSVQIERWPLGKRLVHAHGVDAGQKAANPFQHFPVIKLRAAATAPGADGEIKALKVVQGAALLQQGRDHGDFGAGQLLAEAVFFQNLLAAPAAGAVELEHDLVAIVEHGLVDAVFVRGQSRQPPVTEHAGAGQRVQHHIRRELGIGVLALCFLRRQAQGVHRGLVFVKIVLHGHDCIVTQPRCAASIERRLPTRACAGTQKRPGRFGQPRALCEGAAV